MSGGFQNQTLIRSHLPFAMVMSKFSNKRVKGFLERLKIRQNELEKIAIKRLANFRTNSMSKEEE